MQIQTHTPHAHAHTQTHTLTHTHTHTRTLSADNFWTSSSSKVRWRRCSVSAMPSAFCVFFTTHPYTIAWTRDATLQIRKVTWWPKWIDNFIFKKIMHWAFTKRRQDLDNGTATNNEKKDYDNDMDGKIGLHGGKTRIHTHAKLCSYTNTGRNEPPTI